VKRESASSSISARWRTTTDGLPDPSARLALSVRHVLREDTEDFLCGHALMRTLLSELLIDPYGRYLPGMAAKWLRSSWNFSARRETISALHESFR
jgi:hypothetical protein